MTKDKVERAAARAGACVSLLLLAGAGEIGCDVVDDVETESELPTWEEFRAQSRRVFEGRERFVVEGDISLDEGQLRDYYDAALDEDEDEFRSIVNVVHGHRDIWNASVRHQLTYCVSDEFGADRDKAIRGMAQATEDWEARANVNFHHKWWEGANCDHSNTNVVFAVRPWADVGACAFFPSNPAGACVPRTLTIDLDYKHDPAAKYDHYGLFRHELGHILGLRHEHTHPVATAAVCKGSGPFEMLTAYDKDSVMHYPWCDGNFDSKLEITALDTAGIRALYGQGSSVPIDFQNIRIRPMSAPGQCLDIDGGNTANGTNVQQWNCNWLDPQLFDLVRKRGGYQIVNRGTGKCLDVQASGTANGTNVYQWDCIDGAQNQLWVIERGSGDAVRIRSAQTFMSLDVAAFGTTPGTNIYVWTTHSGPAVPNNQFFYLEHTDGTRLKPSDFPIPDLRILPMHAPGQCLDVDGGNPANGTNVQQWDCNGLDPQFFDFVRKPGGYQIINRATGKCLDVEGAGTHDGTNVWQWECIDGAQNQLWIIDSGAGDAMRIRSAQTFKALDVAGVGTSPGTNVQIWTTHSGPTVPNNQFFLIARPDGTRLSSMDFS